MSSNWLNRMVGIWATKGSHRQYKHPTKPGCVATGKTRDEVALNMHEAVEMHVRGLIKDNLSVPKPATEAEYIAIPV
jgi:predicted RNase H-like HicB family nuclease